MAHLKLLLLLPWVGVTVSMVVDLHKRIIGGQECLNNERQYHVKFKFQNGDICGGSLIHKQWVLTAAHCWDSNRPMTVVLGLHPRGGQPQNVQIECQKPYHDHDFMLLKLSKPSDITPVDLPDCNKRPQKKEKVQIAGYASTKLDANNKIAPGQSKTLQCAMTDVDDCLPDLANVLPEHMFCGKRDGVDASPGDSGGGVVYNNKIYGVIATAFDTTHGIAPTAFIDVCEYMVWIQDTIRLNKCV